MQRKAGRGGEPVLAWGCALLCGGGAQHLADAHAASVGAAFVGAAPLLTFLVLLVLAPILAVLWPRGAWRWGVALAVPQEVALLLSDVPAPALLAGVLPAVPLALIAAAVGERRRQALAERPVLLRVSPPPCHPQVRIRRESGAADRPAAATHDLPAARPVRPQDRPAVALGTS